MDVLLVEDDQALAAATAELLRARGHAVTVAGSVADAVDALVQAHTFQTVFLDLRLGEERGETVIDRMKALHRAYPPVVILSAQPQQAIASAAEAIGASNWISKPASAAELDAMIDQLTGKSESD